MERRYRRHAVISRRKALRLLAGASAATVLVACGNGGAVPNLTAPAPTTAGAPSPLAAGATPSTVVGTPPVAALQLPNTTVAIPSGQVSLRMVDNSTNKAPFLNAVFAAYQQKYPNVRITHDTLPAPEVAKVVPLGIQNGNAHDVFQLPPGITAAQAVAQGWLHPLDDIIPDFAQWRAAFPPNSFFEGSNVFKGKTYTFPTDGNWGYDTFLFYNAEYMQRAGVDPQAKPLTWGEYRATARKITAQGAGKYYGVMIEGGATARFEAIVRNLAQMAGAVGGTSSGVTDLDWKTGHYLYASDQYLAVIDLLLALKADGSVFPGALALNQNQARAQMAQGVTGMILSGIYSLPFFLLQNPDFVYGVTSQPVPDNGVVAPWSYGPPSGLFWAYAQTKYPQIVGDLLAYIGSEAGQEAQIRLYDTPLPVRFPRANAQGSFDPRMRKLFPLLEQQTRLGPNPVVRNPDVANVLIEQKQVTPNFGSIVQGIYTGQIGEAKKAMQDLTDRADKELERAIKAAQAKGAKASRDDYVFPNWDHSKDYTDADYAALKK